MINLEFARRRKGWTQRQLGDLVRIHQTFISMIERGAALPTADQADRIARALDVDPETLTQQIRVTVPGYENREHEETR